MTFSDEILAPPLAEPLHLTEVKVHVEEPAASTRHDTLLSALVCVARRKVETLCGRALVRQQRILTLDSFPRCIHIPVAPVRAVQSVQYVDTDGVTQTLSSALYRVDSTSAPGRITPAYGEVWPATQAITNAVTVKYTAGYVAPIASFDTSADTITAKGHDLAADTLVVLTNSGGSLQSGLAALTHYYVKASATDTLQLSLTPGGTAVDITATTAGSGQSFVGELEAPIRSAMLLIIGHLFEHREEVGDFETFQLPMATGSLLEAYRVMRF